MDHWLIGVVMLNHGVTFNLGSAESVHLPYLRHSSPIKKMWIGATDYYVLCESLLLFLSFISLISHDVENYFLGLPGSGIYACLSISNGLQIRRIQASAR